MPVPWDGKSGPGVKKIARNDSNEWMVFYGLSTT